MMTLHPSTHRQHDPQSEMNKLIRQIMLTPGRAISFTLLNQKGVFRRNVHGYTGRQLMQHLMCNILPKVPLGEVQAITISGNKTKVYFFVKDELPEEENAENTMNLIHHLAKIGLDINEYTLAYQTINTERLVSALIKTPFSRLPTAIPCVAFL